MELNDSTIAFLFLPKGRTHQIRVHAKYLGHPLLGECISV